MALPNNEIDPSRVFNPLSTPNAIAGFLVVVGLASLGYAMFAVAKQRRGRGATPAPGATLAPAGRDRLSTNALWSLGYVGTVVILMGFALGWVYD
ncbi:MAG: hypothetical protein ACO35C_03955 [Pontimonas sp.]